MPSSRYIAIFAIPLLFLVFRDWIMQSSEQRTRRNGERLSTAETSLHWYSYNKNPRQISDTFWTLNRLLPDYRKLVQEENADSNWVDFARLPKPVRILLSRKSDTTSLDLQDELVRMTSEIIAELANPGSNQKAELLIACSTGDIDSVERISITYEAEDRHLPLHDMIIVAMDNSQVKITAFCLKKGAVLDNDEARYAAWLGRSAELFALLFQYNIFQLDEEPGYIHQLLRDAVNPTETLIAGGKPLKKRRSVDIGALAEFLVDQGASVDAAIINKAGTLAPLSSLKFLLSQFKGELDGSVLRNVLMMGPSDRWRQAPKVEVYECFALLLPHVSKAIELKTFVRDACAMGGPRFVDLLLSHGATLEGTYVLHVMAILGGPAEMILYVINHGMPINEKVDRPIDQEDWYHKPTYQFYPLHYAVAHKKPEAVRLLLEHGADPWLKNKAGQTAFEVEIVEYWTMSGMQSYSLENRRQDEERLAKSHAELVEVHKALLDFAGLSEDDVKLLEIKEKFDRVEKERMKREQDQLPKYDNILAN